MTLGDFLLNEKTKVSLSIINFVILVGFVVTAAFTSATYITEAAAKDIAQDVRMDTIESDRIAADVLLEQEQKEQRIQMSEVQNGQTELKIGQARLETHLINILKRMDTQ